MNMTQKDVRNIERLFMAGISGKPTALIVIPEVEGWQGWVVLGLVGFMLLALVAELAPPHIVMMGTLIICLSLSIIDIRAAFHGFSDEAMLSVAVLFVVAKGIEMSGGLEYVASVLFRAPNKSKSMRPGIRPSRTEGSIVWVLLKFCIPVAIFSAFLANIPLVAMMIPPILEFANKVKVAPSKMLMPLSYAAQLGGTMTLIGASTNLVVLSMAAQKLPNLHMSLFEIGVVGLPVTIAGIFYIIAFSGKLLPDRESTFSTAVAARDYNIVVALKQNSKLAQRSIEWSGLGRQPGLNLVAITRDIDTILDPAPEVVLQPKDRLHFVGVIDSILLLAQVYGLILTEDEGQGEVDLNQLKATQILVEAVIGSGSSMAHERVADLQCRTRFNTTIVAIHRHRKRLTSLIGEIRVEPGDCLLMVADTPDFVTKHRTNSHFALVSQLPGFKPLNRKKACIASILVVAMVVASGVGMDLLMCALLSSAGLLLTRCLTPHDAMEAIELPVLIMIAAAFGIAEAMVESGAATILAKALMGLAGNSMFGLISCTYIATTLFSLAITNSAAVTIMFPVALAASNHQALDFRPFAYTLMMAASAGLMTPTACPTNLMVYGPGSYKFSDYIHYGGPLQLWLLFVTVGVTMSSKYWYVWAIVIFALTCGAIPLVARHKSTHPMLVTHGGGAPNTKSRDGEHDDENPSAALNAVGRALMLAPGHDNEETITRRMSQIIIPPTTSSSSKTSIPSQFSSPFPPPYRLDDSYASSSSSSSTSSSSGTSQTNKDFNASSFPPPYRLDDSFVPIFPSIRTSLSFKAAQFIYDAKPDSYDSIASSSSSSTQTTIVAATDPPVEPLADLPASVVLFTPQAAQQPPSQSLEAQQQSPQNPPTNPTQMMVNHSFGAMATPQETKPRLDVGPFRTRQTVVQKFSSPSFSFYSPPIQPIRVSSEVSSSLFYSPPIQPIRVSSEASSSSFYSPPSQNIGVSSEASSSSFYSPPSQPIGVSSEAASSFYYSPPSEPKELSSEASSSSSSAAGVSQPLDGTVESIFLQTLDDKVDSYTNVNISEESNTGNVESILVDSYTNVNISEESNTGNVESIFLQPLVDNTDSFTDVTISEENTSSSSSIGPTFYASSNAYAPSTSIGPLTTGSPSSGGGSSEAGPMALLTKLFRPSFSSLILAVEEKQSQPTTTPSNAERPSILVAGGSPLSQPTATPSNVERPSVLVAGGGSPLFQQTTTPSNDERPSVLAVGGGSPLFQPTTTPSNAGRPSILALGRGSSLSQFTATPSNAERPSVLAIGGGSPRASPRKASKRISTYTRSGRRTTRTVGRKKSKSPRSGRASPQASSRAAAAERASNEEDLTGGISNLLSSRRLSSINDTSAFADNASVVDH